MTIKKYARTLNRFIDKLLEAKNDIRILVLDINEEIKFLKKEGNYDPEEIENLIRFRNIVRKIKVKYPSEELVSFFEDVYHIVKKEGLGND